MVRFWFLRAACSLIGLAAISSHASAQQYADVLGDYNPGDHVATIDVFGFDTLFDNAAAALGAPGQIVLNSQSREVPFVSLGGWTRSGATANESVGLIVGFSQGLPNLPGNDLAIMGNNSFGFHEPGFVEVAIESNGGGATPSGWTDETFYLLKPSNFASLDQDPRLGPTAITYADSNNDFTFEYLAGSAFETNAATGWVDFAIGTEDLFDLDTAVDANMLPVALQQIAYVRIRSVTDSSIDFSVFGATGLDYFSTEVDYLRNLHAPIPEPTTLALLASASLLLIARRTR